MTKVELIIALSICVKNLKADSDYQWGHMGSCNCGHLAQQLTHLTKAQIHESAMERMGDWNDQVMEYCPDSGLQIDVIIETMIAAGLTRLDICQLEKLSNPEILSEIPEEEKPLVQNRRSDVIKYMKAWITILESTLAEEIDLVSFSKSKDIECTMEEIKFS